ncbi:MAG: hypothetical protein IT423_17065 [Pirellulaceae bacterium]|nr:hypothetical protein [Pirellulaceae bacterium]
MLKHRPAQDQNASPALGATAQPAAGQTAGQPVASQTVAGPRARPRWLSLLVACTLLLILIGWWINAPGMWMRSRADRELRQHDPKAAMEWVNRALNYAPQDAYACLLAARAHMQMNMNALATQWLQQARAKATKPDSGDGPGEVRDQQLAEQIAAYELIIQAQTGDSAAADKLLQREDSIPLPMEAYEALIRNAQFQNNLERARLILDQLEQKGETLPIVAYHRGRNCELSDQMTEATEFYAQAYQLQPRLSRAAFRAGICYYNRKEFEKAAAMFGTLTQSPYRLIANLELATCLWEQNKLDQALPLAQEALDFPVIDLQTLYMQLDEYVDNDRAALVMACIEDGLGHAQEAVALLERVLKFNHRDFEGRTLLIKNLRTLKRDTEADQWAALQQQMIANRLRCRQLRLELEQTPDDMDKLCELAELYWYTESVAEAQLLLRDILSRDPNCERAMRLLAQINDDQQRHQQLHRPVQPELPPELQPATQPQPTGSQPMPVAPGAQP